MITKNNFDKHDLYAKSSILDISDLYEASYIKPQFKYYSGIPKNRFDYLSIYRDYFNNLEGHSNHKKYTSLDKINEEKTYVCGH